MIRILRTQPIFWMLLLLLACDEASTDSPAASGDKLQVVMETVAEGIPNPWGMAFLPDGRLLVSEKSKGLILVEDGKKSSVTNLPKFDVNGQGGFLDVVLHPEYSATGWIYFTFSSPEGEGSGSHTALMRAKLEGNALVSKQLLYKGKPNTRAGQHYGSRIAFDRKGYVYFSIGDRGNRDENPQDLSRDGGKIFRLKDDGGIPNDNPFVDSAGALPAIFTYGHRNPQGLAMNPETGEIWSHEHGPQGGDEINILKKGANYGWPEVTFGENYGGGEITPDTAKPGMEAPLHYWTPSIAPCGMAFVTGDRYPGWKGDLMVGSLKFTYLAHVDLHEGRVKAERKLLEGKGRMRSVVMGPDGYLYVGIEGAGKIVRLLPSP